MGTFFKTFLICLIATLGFLFYKVVGNNSYSPELNIKNGQIYGTEANLPKEENTTPTETKQKEKIVQNKEIQEEKKESPEEKKEPIQDKKENYKYVCYFYSKSGQLVQTTKQLTSKPTLQTAVTMLLKGPTISDSKKGIYSEIPSGVDLISITKRNNKITLNLTSAFANDSSFQSVENRLKQLSKTIKYYEPKSQIYLLLDGKTVEYIGGDGVYVKQPLE